MSTEKEFKKNEAWCSQSRMRVNFIYTRYCDPVPSSRNLAQARPPCSFFFLNSFGVVFASRTTSGLLSCLEFRATRFPSRRFGIPRLTHRCSAHRPIRTSSTANQIQRFVDVLLPTLFPLSPPVPPSRLEDFGVTAWRLSASFLHPGPLGREGPPSLADFRIERKRGRRRRRASERGTSQPIQFYK